MKIEKFWNTAFLAALNRLPAEQAKAEADLATDLCVKHWQSQRFHWAPQNLRSWQEQNIFHVPWDPRQEESPKSPIADPSL